MTYANIASEPAPAALLLVDCINDFYRPDGQSYYGQVADTVEPIQALLAGARHAGSLIVHAVERHRPGLPDAEQPKLPVHDVIGSSDTEIFDPFVPRLNTHMEVVVGKRRYSAFFATDLALLLAENRVSTLVLAGVKTNVCIRATATDAFAHGLRVVVPREATNSNREHLARASLEDIDRYLGTVCATEQAIKIFCGSVGS
jgi:nicotinamidase-related amidase